MSTPAPNNFKLTYATMFNPPETLHSTYEQALADAKANLGQHYAMLIDNEDIHIEHTFENRSPINTNWLLGHFPAGDATHATQAVEAAQAAFPAWASTPWQQRVALLRKAAALIEERVYQMAAIISLDVGKNRMEALGDAQEAADLIYYACDDVERNNGFIREMGRDPIAGYDSRNTSSMKPYGVWVVISPFNFPAALSGGPAGAALVTGNTVVYKPAPKTPWVGRLLAECMRDAGLPPGVFNYVTDGFDNAIGKALVADPRVAGITFTGSYAIGMDIYRNFAAGGAYPRPVVLEMGGKNAAIVSASADLDVAAMGIVRAAFGLQGQKCSACSRVLADTSIKDELAQKVVALTEQIVSVGDPTQRQTFMGPVISEQAYHAYAEYAEDLSQAGDILTGGKHLFDGDLAHGYYCAPTVIAGVSYEHRLWSHEMFLPITMIGGVHSLDEAMTLANSVDYGLTAGFYGSEDEAQWFSRHIQAGVTYINRPQGATTGAWPGLQPFGGWKGSGSTGRNAGGHYYLLSYMHEQSRTIVRKEG